MAAMMISERIAGIFQPHTFSPASVGLEPRVCRVPPKFGYMNLARALAEMALPFDAGTGEPAPMLDLRALEFCDPSAVVALAAFAAHRTRTTGNPVELVGWEPSSYLSRVGLKTLAGYRDDYPSQRHDGDRLTSIIEVATAGERAQARTDVLDVLDIQHAGSRLVLDYCIEEVLRNVEDHADSPVNGLIQAQFYQTRRQVVVGIADTGHGILWNLRQRHQEIEDHEQALRLALKPGVSGRNTRKGSNAGLGLTVSSSLIARMGGMFQIASGNSVLDITDGGVTVHKLEGAVWPGVLVSMSVPRDDTLDWEGTFTGVMGAL